MAADNKIYLSSEDGEILVVAAGRAFKHITTNSMGDLLMSTPALSDGVMYVRAASSLFAVGRKETRTVTETLVESGKGSYPTQLAEEKGIPGEASTAASAYLVGTRCFSS